MANLKYYLAIDLGAGSGRHIVGYKQDNQIITEEVYRFSNGVKQDNNHLIWDIEYLLNEVKKGIDVALSKYPIESLSIDTWGVDYVLLNGDQEILPAYSYRDSRTSEVFDEVHSLISLEELYQKTGVVFETYNTIYQLYWDYKNHRLDKATDFLLMAEYLLYKLCGVKANEFTHASTTGMLNSETMQFDEEIIDRLSLPKHLFKQIHKSKEVIGEYKGIKVVLCGCHDTASAVEAIPMSSNQPYISSGTWSLLGIKTDKPITSLASMKANYSNEGGVSYNRFQKSIMGLWIINNLRKELCPNISHEEIVAQAKASYFNELIDCKDQVFFAPKSMKEAFDITLSNKPTCVGDYLKCAYESLANSYCEAIKELESITNKTFKEIYIVGGGAKSTYLNELTEKYTGKKIIALPIEASSIGNLKIQMEIDNDNIFNIYRTKY